MVKIWSLTLLVGELVGLGVGLLEGDMLGLELGPLEGDVIGLRLGLRERLMFMVRVMLALGVQGHIDCA
jgi:hypothetical protein